MVSCIDVITCSTDSTKRWENIFLIWRWPSNTINNYFFVGKIITTFIYNNFINYFSNLSWSQCMVLITKSIEVNQISFCQSICSWSCKRVWCIVMLCNKVSRSRWKSISRKTNCSTTNTNRCSTSNICDFFTI